MGKVNIFRKEWLDLVFENRNKEYGAYQLRMENPKTTILSFFMGIGLLGVVFGSTVLLNPTDTASIEVEEKPVWDVPLLVDLPPKMKEEKKVVIPKTVQPEQGKVVKLKNSTIAFVEPNVVSNDKVTHDLPNMEDLVLSTPGSVTQNGSEDGVLYVGDGLIGDTFVEGVEGGVADGALVSDAVFRNVQVKATPVGGFEKFGSTFSSRFRTENIAEAPIREIKVIVSFIVEIDGSLTDIMVLRDPGYGAGGEAVRVLKSMPKWRAAQHNGKAVRSQFTLPIAVKVQ